MSFPPFIEGETNPNSTIRISSSIDISDFSHVLQGIDDKLRSKGVLPVISSGDDDYSIKQIYYGQEKDYNDEIPFADRSQPTAQQFITSPHTYNDINYSFGFSKSGVIEPLLIRDVITFDSIDLPIKNSIKGEAEQINVFVDGKSDVIQQLIEIRRNSSIAFFEDSTEYAGSFLSSSIIIPGYISEQERTIISFDDSNVLFRQRSNNGSINSALNNLTGSRRDGNELIPIGFRSSGAGFSYYSSSFGTDSIAFGNLLGSRE